MTIIPSPQKPHNSLWMVWMVNDDHDIITTPKEKVRKIREESYCNENGYEGKTKEGIE